MGVTTLVIDVANSARPTVMERLEFTVDSGATYSVVPAPVLRRLRIRPLRREKWIGGGDVIFGEKGDAVLLGALTLEALGLSLDPIKRELKPLQLVL